MNYFGVLSLRSATLRQDCSDALSRRVMGHAIPFKLLVFAACVSLFLGVINNAAAHNDPHPDSPVVTTAKDVVRAEPENRKEELKNFVNHASLHLLGTSSFTESLNLMNSLRVEGQWRSGSVYLILLTKKGGVYIHPGDRELEDQDWSEKLVGCEGESWNELVSGGGGCVRHVGQDKDIPSGYAVVTGGPFVPFSKPGVGNEGGFVFIGGLDYRPEPESYATFEELKNRLIEDLLTENPSSTSSDVPDEEENVERGCPGTSTNVSPDEREENLRMCLDRLLTPSIDAADVNTQSHMREFLVAAFNFITFSFHFELLDSVILRKIFRYDGGPWRNGSTYIYIMDDAGNVVFNGANRNIEQTDLWSFEGDHKEGRDPDYRFFIQRIIRAAQKPGGGFVEYDWDNPNVEGDEPVNLGDPGGGSSKLGYAIQLPPDGEPGRVYVFGTGLYLSQEEDELVDEGDDSGCSVAGPDKEAGSAAANFLAVMALLALAFLPGIGFSGRKGI